MADVKLSTRPAALEGIREDARDPAKASLWERISRLGTDGLPFEEERKVRLLNQCAVIAAATCVAFDAGYLTDPRKFGFGILVNSAAAVLQLAVLAMTARRRYLLALMQFLVVCNLQLGLATAWMGPALGYHYYFLAFVSVVFLVTPRRYAFVYPMLLVSIACFVYFAFGMRAEDAWVFIDPMIAWLISVATVVGVALTLALVAYLFDADTREAELKLVDEHARSERLLLNILPRSISERLKRGNESIADGFADVSVVFADLVGFTELSSRMNPEDLVEVLNDVFSRFDTIVDELGLEKIKTIGDAYMVASGLPEPTPDHAEKATELAVRMGDALAQVNASRGTTLEVRIGVHAGPVVAGVIGRKKFIYDLWGDTVNIASRMESHGVKGRVQVSEAVAKRIEGTFDLEPREPMTIKGKGRMQTFLVLGRKG